MLANGHPVYDTRVFVKEARTLVQSGYSVSIIIPANKDDQRDGVSVLAVKQTKSGWQKLLLNPWNILRKAFGEPVEAIYHIHDSDILVVGIVLKLAGRKVIYDAHEDTPLQIAYQHWLPGYLKKPYALFYFIIEKISGWIFDRIIVAEPVIAKYFPPRKTYLIRNFPIVNSFRRHQQRPYGNRKKRLLHVGSLSKVRGLFEMLEGAKLASEEKDFEFFLGGKFAPPDLEKSVVANYKVTFRGWVSYDELVDLLFDSRIGIIIPHPVERYKTNYPVKLFEFLAAGLPVIASREGESAAFIKEAECGLLVDPLNVKEIAEAIVWLFNHPEQAEAMGKRGQELIFTKYNWEQESATLLNMYSGLLRG